MKGSREVQPIRDIEKIEHMKYLLRHYSYRHYFFFVFGLNTGLRGGDILRLKVKDVRDREHLRLKESKTRKINYILINPEFKVIVEDYIRFMADDDYLFRTWNVNEPFTRGQAWRVLREMGLRVGVKDVGAHSMRKTFGYHYYLQFKDIVTLMRIFNHSEQEVTLRYIGILQDYVDEQMKTFHL